MNPAAAIYTCLVKWLDYDGRASRSEFWFWIAFLFILFGLGEILRPFKLLLALMIFPTLAVSIRRMHDINYSPWWFLLLIIPVFGLFTLAVIHMKPGTVGDNKYGVPP
ncbi:DUF805 domain-containing protein [Pseudomonas alkylphenolica]|nr:DUF805 domain-containing protein [Pseudomonas alkylphenolica]